MAEPDSGRPLQLRRPGAPASPRRRRGAGRDPRPRPLGVVDRRRPRGEPGRDGARAASRSRATRSRWPSASSTSSPTRACGYARPPSTAARGPVRTGAATTPTSRVSESLVDSLTLRIPARTLLRSDERGIPVERLPVGGTDYDFRRPRAIGATVLDHAFTDLERGEDGRARVELRDPDDGQRAHALGRRDAFVRDGVQRGSASGREPAQPRRRADDVSTERVPQRQRT